MNRTKEVMIYLPIPSIASGIRTRIDSAIFALDVYELIERCHAVVCNLNGRVPDEGMIVEASLAYAAGKPLVLFKDDVRAPFGGVIPFIVHKVVVKRELQFNRLISSVIIYMNIVSGCGLVLLISIRL